MTATVFQCDKCLKTGLVKHNNGADVCSVLNLIRDKHAQVSPKCMFDESKVRVISVVEDAEPVHADADVGGEG